MCLTFNMGILLLKIHPTERQIYLLITQLFHCSIYYNSKSLETTLTYKDKLHKLLYNNSLIIRCIEKYMCMIVILSIWQIQEEINNTQKLKIYKCNFSFEVMEVNYYFCEDLKLTKFGPSQRSFWFIKSQPSSIYKL